jgi:KDO2-lipid IV(A) lauroyltransferase
LEIGKGCFRIPIARLAIPQLLEFIFPIPRFSRYTPNEAMRHRIEYALVWPLVKGLGALPRPLARLAGLLLAGAVYYLHPRLRRVGLRNLEIAMPELPPKERRRIVRGVFRSLARLLVEFCRFPKYTRANVSETAVYEGFENFDAAERRGKGVLLLTAHLGGWEVGSFVHSVHGHPLRIVVRPLDNPYVNALVERYRTLHGSRTFAKKDFARGLLSAMQKGETVGLLMDQNMTPPQGEFVPFFGVQACTASGIARVAMKTGAAVVPAFTIWDGVLRKYRIRFDPPLTLVRTGNTEKDVTANTALFNQVLEEYVRKYPDQWLWVHRRWKTRPPGEPRLY